MAATDTIATTRGTFELADGSLSAVLKADCRFANRYTPMTKIVISAASGRYMRRSAAISVRIGMIDVGAKIAPTKKKTKPSGLFRFNSTSARHTKRMND